MLNHMDAEGTHKVEAALRPEDADMAILPWIDTGNFNPTYLVRDLDHMPKRGDKPEWQHNQDYWSERNEIPAIDPTASEFVYDGERAEVAALEAAE